MKPVESAESRRKKTNKSPNLLYIYSNMIYPHKNEMIAQFLWDHFILWQQAVPRIKELKLEEVL